MQETWVRSLGREDPLEKEMATHSSILAWKIPWTKEPCGLQSVGSQSRTGLSNFTFTFFQESLSEDIKLPGNVRWIGNENIRVKSWCFHTSANMKTNWGVEHAASPWSPYSPVAMEGPKAQILLRNVLHQREPGLLGEMTDFRARAGRAQSESEVAQSCPTLCDPMDCSPSGSSVHGIFQTRVLEWVAIAFSREGTRADQNNLCWKLRKYSKNQRDKYLGGTSADQGWGHLGIKMGLPQWLTGKRICLLCMRHRRHGFDPWVRKILLEEMATHCSSLAWKIPRTEEPGELQYTESQRVKHDWVTNTFTSLPHTINGLQCSKNKMKQKMISRDPC